MWNPARKLQGTCTVCRRRHKATFAVPLFENMNEDSTVELQVRLLGEGTDCSRPTKAINIEGGFFQLDAPNLYVARTRVQLIVPFWPDVAKTILRQSNERICSNI
jgi:hypothetical protein